MVLSVGKEPSKDLSDSSSLRYSIDEIHMGIVTLKVYNVFVIVIAVFLLNNIVGNAIEYFLLRILFI